MAPHHTRHRPVSSRPGVPQGRGGSMRGIGWKLQETMDVRIWGTWGPGRSSYRKGRLPGGGEVAFGGPRETRTGFVRLMWNSPGNNVPLQTLSSAIWMLFS